MAALGKMKAAAKLSADGPPFPEPLEYIWEWFVQHARGLAAAGFGFPSITWEGLQAWSWLLQIELEPWEADLLVTLSIVRANVNAEKTK